MSWVSTPASLELQLERFALDVGELHRRQKRRAEQLEEALVQMRTTFLETVRSMAQLNRVGCELMVQAGARAATDITGFGMLGHAMDMYIPGVPIEHGEQCGTQRRALLVVVLEDLRPAHVTDEGIRAVPAARGRGGL